jgi:inner membrane protein
MAVGAIAGAFPDIDYIASWVDPIVYMTLWHRGITHSFVLLPLRALLVGVVLAFAFKQRKAWPFVTAIAGVSVLSHILSDLITVFGTQVLAPLSSWRASVGTTFIIDPWFSAIVLAGFLAGLSKKPYRWLPRLSLTVLVAYIGFQGFLKHQALSLAQEQIRRENLFDASATALPQPVSPFNWKLIIDNGNRYEVAYVNLAGGYSAPDDANGFWNGVHTTYKAPDNLSWETYRRFGDDMKNTGYIRALWENPQLDYFRRFAEFPVLYRIDNTADGHCVWFTDLRYVLPYMTPPFRYGLCQDNAAASWALERLRK